MLLLSAPKKTAKDAARAIGRVTPEMKHPVTKESLGDLLELPNIVVTSYAIETCSEQDILHLFCEHKHKMAICPRCGQASTAFHDAKERCVRHLDVWDKVTFVHFPSRRFDCDKCEKPFTEQLSWIDEYRRQTCAFEHHIYQRCKQTARATVANEEWLHQETVKTIFLRWAERSEEKKQRPKVRVLGIDEISLKKRHQQYALVLSDLERHCVIDVLPERKKKLLEQWIDDLTVEEQKAIKVVSMDMWRPYRWAVEAKLSHAEIVADRFHVMKQLVKRLKKAWRKLRKEGDPETRQALKGLYWIIQKNRDDLDSDEEEKLVAALEASPTFRVLYLLKEEFRTICEKLQDRSRAVRFLEAWLWRAENTGNKHLCKFVNTLRNWWDEFLNYFNERVTNGFVEGINLAIRNTIRRACGYHVFENFRLQILAEHGELGPDPPLI